LFTANVPAIIREPELAFNAEKWRHPKGNGMISHKRPPYYLLSGRHDKSGFVGSKHQKNLFGQASMSEIAMLRQLWGAWTTSQLHSDGLFMW
jgi:hypothetical protein